MHVDIIADDLTGAADSDIQFCRAVFRTAVAFRDTLVPLSKEPDTAIVDANSCLLSEREARKRVREAEQTLKHTRTIYKKIDLALRGPFATELEAVLEAAGRFKATVAPVFSKRPINERMQCEQD